jgi:hypothetical protein
MIDEITNILRSTEPLVWVVSTIFAVYFIAKMYKDVRQWFIDFRDKRDEKIAIKLNKCNIHETRITVIEKAIEWIKSEISEIKLILKEKL